MIDEQIKNNIVWVMLFLAVPVYIMTREGQHPSPGIGRSAVVWNIRPNQIGRASCRERGEISVVAVSLKKKHDKQLTVSEHHSLGSPGRTGGVAEPGASAHLGFLFSSRRRHTRLQGDWSSDVCSSDLSNAYADFCFRPSFGYRSSAFGFP